jgi:hypothetical protein
MHYCFTTRKGICNLRGVQERTFNETHTRWHSVGVTHAAVIKDRNLKSLAQ